MDFCLKQSINSLQEAFINPTEPSGNFFMMDGFTLWGFKISTTIHSYYKAWKSQDIFLCNSDCIRLKEESHIHLGWLEGKKRCSSSKNKLRYFRWKPGGLWLSHWLISNSHCQGTEKYEKHHQDSPSAISGSIGTLWCEENTFCMQIK